MEKFGIFDLINKLTPQNNGQTNQNLHQPVNNNPNAKNQQNDKKQVKSSAYLSTVALLKRHEEISKRIDKNNRR